MTRILLIHAGPTPWDEVNRLTGSHSLPLTADAAHAVQSLIDAIPSPISGLYLCRDNEACEQVGQLLARKFDVRLRDRPELQEMNLGLWEGLTRDELRRRFPTAFAQFEEAPLSVVPPGGETVGEAIERVRPVVRKILRRSAGDTAAVVVRPLLMQMVRGLLLDETAEAIANHLHNVDVMENIEIPGL